ncbi:Flp family type IVb pilin [uncultured Selenomonas sp.]|jgi:pilus assembly protein Flp/PilA|uniref:Flp family type IVb pilin n=1 Tax=uncultured Selenomonas sp. TaxID=159275 RepID=UPI0026006C41|nr:pilin protein [uncultured Selenomonas sp.]
MIQIFEYLKARYVSEKAQGIVEYALILAFVVVLAIALTNAGGLADKVKGVFTSVGSQLDKTGAQ